eukprot:6857607-Karenia_brevis.AAC.1
MARKKENKKQRELKKHQFVCFACKESHTVEHFLVDKTNQSGSEIWRQDIVNMCCGQEAVEH